MKKLFLLAIPVLSAVFPSVIKAQSKAITISGKVISFEESLALEGVSITVKGTNKNSGTQADGTFSISITPEEKSLVFSLAGYQTQELAITERTDYEIILKREGSYDHAFSKAGKMGYAKIHIACSVQQRQPLQILQP
jgi:hypothetical protein